MARIVEALIFDCDGTLVDTETPYRQSLNETIARFAAGAAPEIGPERWGAEFSGRGVQRCAELGAALCSGVAAEAFLHAWLTRFAELIAEPGSVPLLPGFDELYARARARGLRLAVASSSDGAGLLLKLRNGVVAQSAVLKAVDGPGGFDAVTSNDDVTKHKPDPEIYLVTAARLGVAPERCWVVEDTSTGVAAGKNAGMRVAAVPNLFTKGNDFSRADVVLETMAEVIPLLEAS